MLRLVIDGLNSKMMASSRGQKILPKPSFNMCMTMSTIQDQQHFPCHHQLCMLVICSLLSQNYEVNNKNILVQCKMLQFLYHVKKEKISLLQGTGRLEESLHVYKMSISPRVQSVPGHPGQCHTCVSHVSWTIDDDNLLS